MSIASIQHSTVVSQKDELRKQEINQTPVNSVLVAEEDNSWLGDKLRSVGFNGTADWFEDKDKKCTDGKDDGKISITDKAAGFGKGLLSLVKTAVKNPVTTTIAIAGGVGLVALTGGAILPALITVGAATGAGMIGYGSYKAATAKTDSEAKQAWETIGEGTFTLATSVLGAKSAVNAAGKAGVASASGCEDMTTAQAIKQCVKSTPEALKVGYSNAVQNTKALLGTAQPVKLTVNQIFEQEKTALKNKMRVNMEQTLADSDGLALPKYYKDPKSQQAVMDLVDENNIDLAKALFNTTEQIRSQRHSSYASIKEEVCEYYLETIPKILKSNSKEVQDVAMYIANSDEIVDKFYALKVLTPQNAQQIRALRPYVYQSTEQVAVSNSGQNFLSKLFKSERYEIRTIDKTMSIDRQLWKDFLPPYVREETLPVMGTNIAGQYNVRSSHLFLNQYFAKPGTIPNVPGAHHPVNIYTGDIDYSRYVVYEELSPTGFFTGMDKAKELLNTFGSSPATEAVTAVPQTAEMRAAQKAAELERVGNLVKQFMAQ